MWIFVLLAAITGFCTGEIYYPRVSKRKSLDQTAFKLYQNGSDRILGFLISNHLKLIF